MCVQPTWSTCSLSSTSTTSTSQRLLSEFTQEHLANRRKLLADPSDKDSIVAAKESLQGVHPVGCASLHLQATASVHPFGCASLLLRATAMVHHSKMPLNNCRPQPESLKGGWTPSVEACV